MRILPILAVLAVFAALAAPAAHACSCIFPPFEQALAEAHVVFSGRVVAVRTEECWFDTYVYTVQVYECWKGDVEGTIEMGGEAVGTCAAEYPVGAESIWFAHGSSCHTAYVNLCTVTVPLDSQAARDVLGDPSCRSPVDPTPWSGIKARYRTPAAEAP